MQLLTSIIAASRRRATVFNPLSLSPALWLSDTGGDASVWPDISGNGRNATQADSAKQPAIITSALNGRQVRRFDGSNDNLVGTSLNLIQTTSAASIFIVAKAATDAGQYPTILATPTNSTSWRVIFSNQTGGFGYANVSFGSSANFYRGKIATAQYGNYQILNIQYVGSSALANGSFTARYNGTEKIVNLADAYGVDSGSNWTIGSQCNSSSYLKGDIAEILVYPTALSTTDRQNVEGYLNSKYAIY